MTEITKCHDCGIQEGQIHEYGCDMEYCPFCGNQLISCFCSYKILGLVDEKKYCSSSSYLPPSIYTCGLTKELEDKWTTILVEKGRIPYVVYPVICAKCGKLWPEFFSVSDKEWKKYIQINMRNTVLCWECYQSIKLLF